MYAFDFLRPDTLDAALEALKDEDAQALSGGQTLIPTLKARLAMPTVLVSLTDIPELKGICHGDDGRLCIGAATPHAAVAADGSIPALSALAGQIGDPAVRNRGTIGGSLGNNDPAACYPAAALGLGAEIMMPSRSLDADDFFEGLFTTALEEGEIITEVRFPVPEAAAYEKFVQPASRFALVGVFVAKFTDSVRVAVTGASEDGVFRWTAAEEALGADFSPAALEGLDLPSDGMIGDLHATPAYRAHLVGVMTARAVTAAQ